MPRLALRACHAERARARAAQNRVRGDDAQRGACCGALQYIIMSGDARVTFTFSLLNAIFIFTSICFPRCFLPSCLACHGRYGQRLPTPQMARRRLSCQLMPIAAAPCRRRAFRAAMPCYCRRCRLSLPYFFSLMPFTLMPLRQRIRRY